MALSTDQLASLERIPDYPLFRKDKMTRNERSQALMTGQPLDRIAFSLFSFGFSAVNCGHSINDFYSDMQIAFDTGRMTAEQYGEMWIPFGGFPAVGPWEFGGEMQWPTGEFDQCPNAHPAVTTEEGAWALAVPSEEELRELGYTSRFLDFARIASSQGLPFVLALYCPWTTAGNIVGVERLCRWSFKKPELTHHLVRLATDLLLTLQRIIIKDYGAAGNIVCISTASAANAMISPKTFREYALPYLKEYSQTLMELGTQGIFLHICGDQHLNYPMYKEMALAPMSFVSVSHETPLELAMETFPDRPLMGNIEPALLQLGRPEQVYEACRKAIEVGKTHKAGFILAPGCELAPNNPPHNVYMMAKAVNDFGYYE